MWQGPRSISLSHLLSRPLDRIGKEPKPTASIMAPQSCNTCHQTTAKQDYIFTQFYPIFESRQQKVINSKSLSLK